MKLPCSICETIIIKKSNLSFIKKSIIVCSSQCFLSFLELYRNSENITNKTTDYIKSTYDLPLKSSYEVMFKDYLQRNNIKYQYEPLRLYINKLLYIPDFYLPDYNIYIEIKGRWRYPYTRKFNLVATTFSGYFYMLDLELLRLICREY